MSDDLVKRLRNPIDAFRPTISDGREAADRIEELEARNRELALQVIASEGQAQEAYEAQVELEAQLTNAVGERDEALNQLDSARHSVDVLLKRVAELREHPRPNAS